VTRAALLPGDEDTPAIPSSARPAAVVEAARFAPAAPVMTAPAVEVADATGTAELPSADSAAAQPGAAPVVALARVNSRSANLREGPGTDYAVVGRLAKGEAVQIVARDDGPGGWVLVRLEGDGEEGYIAARLLAE
jgi:uncharacterized protein YgiM (DUF1202 family)